MKPKKKSLVVKGIEVEPAPGEHPEGWAQTAASLSEPINVTVTEILEAEQIRKGEVDNG